MRIIRSLVGRSVVNCALVKATAAKERDLRCCFHNLSLKGENKIMSLLGIILVIVAHHFSAWWFSGRFGGYGYGFGHGGIGVIGVILIIIVVLMLLGRI